MTVGDVAMSGMRRGLVLTLVFALGAAGGVGRAETFVTTVPVPFDAFGIAIDPVNDWVYTGHYNANLVSVIDTTGSPTLVTPPLPAGITPYGVAVDPVTHRAYVVNALGGGLTVYDGSGVSPSLVTSVPVGVNPAGVAVDPVTHFVYVADQFGAGQVYVYDGNQTGPILPPIFVASVTVGPGAYGVAVDPNLDRVYITHFGSTTLTVLNVSNPMSPFVDSTVTLDFVGQFVAVDPATGLVYVTHYVWDNSVSVYKGQPSGPPSDEGTIPVVAPPYAIGIDPVTHRVYVTHFQYAPPALAGLVTVIDGAILPLPQVTTKFFTCWEPYGVAADDGDIYVSCYGPNPSVKVYSYPP